MSGPDDPNVPPHRPVDQDSGFPPRSVSWMVKGMVIFTGLMVVLGLPSPLYSVAQAMALDYGLRSLTMLSIMLPFLLWLGNANVAIVGMVFAWRYSRVAAAVLVLLDILKMGFVLNELWAGLFLPPTLPGVLLAMRVGLSSAGVDLLVHILGLVGTLRYHRLLRQRTAGGSR